MENIHTNLMEVLTNWKIIITIGGMLWILLNYFLFYYHADTSRKRMDTLNEQFEFEPEDEKDDVKSVLENPFVTEIEKLELGKKKPKLIGLNTNVHAFYYAWFGDLNHDGEYLHWNHKILPHWNDHVNAQYNIGQRHNPSRDDIGSTFFPQLGPYSSRDPSVIRQHFEWMRDHGIGVCVISWWGRHQSDDEGKSTEELVPLLFEIAEDVGIFLAFHLEPYKDRTVLTVRDDIVYLIEKYGKSKVFYRVGCENLRHKPSPCHSDDVPLFYVYDSYLMKKEDWMHILFPKGLGTIRDTKHNAVIVSLYLDPQKSNSLTLNGHFDGIYTYFAARRFTHGSNSHNWKSLSKWCSDNKLIWIPSVGPGYNDERVRPWNHDNITPRNNGEYYKTSWKNAMDSNPDFVSITSFNEMHEGTQIEPCIRKATYEDYSPHDSMYYLNLTKGFSDSFVKLK